MGLKGLQGTPWHEERAHRKDSDARRYKGRCMFYSDIDNKCSRYNGKCIGSAHCSEYVAMTDGEFKAKQDKMRKTSKKTGEDDCFWY